MEAATHISTSCIIQNNTIVKDGAVVFETDSVAATVFFTKAYQQLELNYPKFYKMDNLCKLGWLAAEILLMDSFDKAAYKPEEVGIVLANANSSLDADLKYWQSAQDVASPALFVYTLPNIVIGEICIRNGFKGEDAFYVMPEPDFDFLKQQAGYLLNNNILKACIYGWVDILGEDYKAELYLITTPPKPSREGRA